MAPLRDVWPSLREGGPGGGRIGVLFAPRQGRQFALRLGHPPPGHGRATKAALHSIWRAQQHLVHGQ